MTSFLWAGVRGSSPVQPRWTVESESGCTVRFADGVSALDLNSGLWNVPLGYRNARVGEAVMAAMTVGSYGGVFRRSSVAAEEVAERLVHLWPRGTYGKVLFATSGSAANDAVIKLSRLHRRRLGRSDRPVVVSFEGSYHGQTLGAMGLSGEDLLQGEMLTAPHEFVKVPVDDSDRVRQILDSHGTRISAVFIEPLQGTGTRPMDDAVLQEIFEARRRHGFLVIADEVATGFGRTGVMFRSARWRESADLVVLSKALTNGTQAASAILVGSEVADVFAAQGAIFPHGETQAGSLWACAAMNAVLDEFEERFGMVTADAQLPETRSMEQFLDKVSAPSMGLQVRGEGMFYTITGTEDFDGLAVGERLRSAGLVVHAGLHSIQLAPPFVLSHQQWADAAETLKEELHRVCADG